MIIKNLTRKKNGTGALIRYILRYTLSKEKQLSNNKDKKFFVLRHNIKSRTIEGYIKEFRELESRRIHKRKDQTVNHVILSWNPADAEKISDATLRAIAKQYIKLRGENSVYIFSKHTDRKHIHLHCAMSSTKLDFYSNRISKAQFADLKVELQNFQIQHFPELSNSLPAHGKSKAIKAKEKQYWRGGRLSQKEILQRAIEEAIQQSKSLEEFVANLKAQGHEPYYRGQEKKLTGIKCEGIKYRFRSLGYKPDTITALTVEKNKEQTELEKIQSIRRHAKTQSKERERSPGIDNDHSSDRRNDAATMEQSDLVPRSISLGRDKGYGEHPTRCILERD